MYNSAMKKAILLFSCPDKPGIVAKVSTFIFEQGGNILHAQEHLDSDSGLFLMRVEWENSSQKSLTIDDLKASFEEIARQFKMDWQLYDPEQKTKIGLLVSKQLHCLADLLFRYKNNNLNCQIPLIISNHEEAKKLADFYQIPFFLIASDDKKKAEQQIIKLLKGSQVETVVLARYMQILSTEFVDQFPNQIINIHHSFLPSFIGAKPYHQAYQRGVKIIGATSHFVTADLDGGPIIEQDVTRISHQESPDQLVQKGEDIEKIVFFKALKAHLEHRVLIYNNRTVVFN